MSLERLAACRSKASRWVSGDLLAVKGPSGKSTFGFDENLFIQVGTKTKEIPFQAKVLFLGETRASNHSLYAKIWWDNKIWWVYVDHLRLVPQGRKSV